MKLGYFKKAKFLNLMVCVSFCLNFVFSNSALAFSKTEASMLRPQAFISGSPLANIFVDLVGAGYGNRGLREALKIIADASLDPQWTQAAGGMPQIIEKQIAFILKGEKAYAISLKDASWQELPDGQENTFPNREEMLSFFNGSRIIWVADNATPDEVIKTQEWTAGYIRKAGQEKRIFSMKGLEEEVADYSEQRVNRGLPALSLKEQQELTNRLDDAFILHTKTIQGLSSMRNAVFILDEEGSPAYFDLGTVGSAQLRTILLSAPTYLKEFGIQDALPIPLALVESWGKLMSEDKAGGSSYRRFMHNYLNREAYSIWEGMESNKKDNNYAEEALALWKKREAEKGQKRLSEEANMVIAEGFRADISAMTGITSAQLKEAADAQLQKLVTSGLLTNYQVAVDDGKIVIFTERQNSKAVEDSSKLLPAIVDVLLNAATQKGLIGKPYREQLSVLNLEVLPSSTYKEPEGWAKEVFGVAASPIASTSTRIAINNPGAQERELIRKWLLGKSEGMELVGVNGVAPGDLFYLLTKDFSATPDFRAWFSADFTAVAEGLVDKVSKKLVLPVTEIANLKDLPWKKFNAQVVIEGKNPQLASSHKAQGADFVIVSHPALTAVSALMPIVSVLQGKKTVKAVNFTDIQPPTSLQRGLDNSGIDPILMRAMGVNIAPLFGRDISEYVQKLLPSLAQQIEGKVITSPQVLGSILDMEIVVGEGTDVKSVNLLFKDAAEGALKGKLIYSEDSSLVSADSYQQPQLIFMAKQTKVTGKIIHLQIMHHEETAFALSQLPLLLEAVKEGKAPAIITSKDSQNITQEAEQVLVSAMQEYSQITRPKFLDVNLSYIPSSDGRSRPKILPSGNAAVVGINGPGRTGRSEIWAWQGDPNLDLRMINGSANGLILSWLLSEDSIQLSTVKPIIRFVLTPEQLKKEISVLLGNYSAEHVNGLLRGLITSERLSVLKENEEFIPYLEKLLTSWGKSQDQLKPAVNSLLKSLVGILDANGKKILLVNERRAVSELPWDAVNIKYISESTGDLKNADEASAHLTRVKSGKVVISAPAEGAGQSIVLGVVKPTRAARIVDNASCTTNCLMPVVAVLDKTFGIISQEILTAHGYTTDQTFAQQAMHKKELGRGRDGRLSAVPSSTGAAKTAAVVVPKLQGLSDGWAVRTDNPTGSVVVLTAILNGKVTKRQIQEALESASQTGELAGILAYTQAPIVSTTILGNPASSIVDGNSIKVIYYDSELDQTIISVDAWYDNETGFAHRMGNLIVDLEGQSLIKGKIIADIGPETVKLFESKLKEAALRTVVWNGPMGVVEVAATSKGTAGITKAILDLKGVIKVVGGGDTLKTLSDEEKSRFDHVSTGGGAFLEAFKFGVENLPGVKALIDPKTGKMPHFDDLLPLLKQGDTVLVRVDFNVPLDSELNVTDNTRIKAALPTIEALLAEGVKVVLMTHLGRPNGKEVKELRTDPVAKELQKLLPTVKVHKLADCVGQSIEDFIHNSQKPGEIVLLENLRFRLAEEQNGSDFARSLSQLADYYVNDAFAVDHREHASVHAITKSFAPGKKFSGRLLENEYDYLKQLRENPEKPLVVVLAGGKVSDKIDIINALKKEAVLFLIGGRMSLAFLAAQGKKVGDSTPDAGDVETAKKFLADPDLAGKIVLPVDGTVVSDVSSGEDAEVVAGEVEPSSLGEFEAKFHEYLQSYIPLMTAEGKARAAAAVSSPITMQQIDSIQASEIYDSRTNPTVKAILTLKGGVVATAAVPSGASTGEREALELRDGQYIKDIEAGKRPNLTAGQIKRIGKMLNKEDITKEELYKQLKSRYGGKGVLIAVDNVNNIIAPAIKRWDVTQQRQIDEKLIALDGTEFKEKLGANAILAVSAAVARAAARQRGLQLYEYIAELMDRAPKIPLIRMFNVINGGEHAGWNVDLQEFMIVPFGFGVGAKTYRERYEIFVNVYNALRTILKQRGHGVGVGDEGGFAPKLNTNEEALALITEAINKAGYKPGLDVAFALDPAASQFFKEGKYVLKVDRRELTPAEMVDYYADLARKYPIFSIEDGMAENDKLGWKLLTDASKSWTNEATKALKGMQIVGDDLFVTNTKIFKEGIAEGLANSILIKLNQIGTVTEALDAIRMAEEAGYTAVISHRSGEDTDDFIADFVVGTGVNQIKTGSARGERVAKDNRIMAIEDRMLAAAFPMTGAPAPMPPVVTAPKVQPAVLKSIQGWTKAKIDFSSVLALLGLSTDRFSEAVIKAAQAKEKKVSLVTASQLLSNPSIIEEVESLNEQVNQRSNVLGSNAYIGAINSYPAILIFDIATTPDELFSTISQQRGKPVNTNIFAKILTQADMYEGNISNPADLLQQLKRMGYAKESIVAAIGSEQWTGGIKRLSPDTFIVKVEEKGGKIALGGNGFYAAVEALATPDRQIPPERAKKLDLVVSEATSIEVRARAVNPRVEGEITTYREVTGRV